MTYDVGINYWPARSAMRWWTEFDANAFADDARLLAEGGCRSIRVFLRWEDFQPRADTIERTVLSNLVTAADTCAEHGLRIIPTLFTGHMSGANWLPAWATKPGPAGRFRTVSGERYTDAVPRNWFDDGEVGDAQELLAREAAGALRSHPALFAWDLGNENSNVCIPATRDAGRAWLARMSGALRAADPSCRVTIGLHMEDLEQDRRIGPAEAAEACDVLCMHGYPLYASWARDRADPALPAFLAEVTRWLGGRDVYFEEFGMPAAPGEEDAQDVFIAEALDLLYEAGTTGAMLWCFSDYAPEIWDRPPLDVAPHERFFGLWRADGTAKPAARHLARYAGIERRLIPARSFEAEPDRFYEDPLATLRRLYDGYATVAA